jgi:tetratricopeptide (TPR) repeat protein
VTAINPWNRDAWFNLANCYLALQDGAKLAEAASKLVEIEPLSEYAYSLVAQGHRMAANSDGVFKAIVGREALLANVEIDRLTLAGGKASLSGKATGREARDENNKVLPAKAQTIVVEFLGKGGEVTATMEAVVPALKPGESAPVAVEGSGAGVTAWRYRLK